MNGPAAARCVLPDDLRGHNGKGHGSRGKGKGAEESATAAMATAVSGQWQVGGAYSSVVGHQGANSGRKKRGQTKKGTGAGHAEDGWCLAPASFTGASEPAFVASGAHSRRFRPDSISHLRNLRLRPPSRPCNTDQTLLQFGLETASAVGKCELIIWISIRFPEGRSLPLFTHQRRPSAPSPGICGAPEEAAQIF